MKRLIKVFNLLLILIVLTGCMKLNVDCGITDDYKSYLEYNIVIDEKDLDEEVKSSVNAFITELTDIYVKDYGFTVLDKGDEDKIDILLAYEKQAKNYEEAYLDLKDILNNPDISFLTSTDMTTSLTKYEQGFTFNGETDVAKILGTSHFQTLPTSIRELITNGLSKSEINFSFNLPPSTITETNGEAKNENGGTTINFPVSLSEASKFNAKARMSIDGNEAVKGDIDTLVKENKQTISLYNTLIPVVFVVIGGLVIGLIYLIRKQRKNKTVPINEEIKGIEE